jgi:hypothetical protein
MPSQLHEAHVLLFRNRPEMAADLTEVAPTEYRADLIVRLFEGARSEKPVYAVIVEIQLRLKEEKRFVWPYYAARDVDPERAARIATAAHAASLDLDVERSRLYFDLDSNSLSEAARRALKSMDIGKYEYQSEFAKRYVAQGVAQGKQEGVMQGEASGRLAIVSRLLVLRFGPIAAEVQGRLRHASVEDLDAIAERVLFAGTLQEALGGSA